MIGFKNTKCKIEDCPNPVWPNKVIGYCNKHYNRLKTGRMKENGDLLHIAKIAECLICGDIIYPVFKAHHIKYCPKCKKNQHNQYIKEYNAGLRRRNKEQSSTKLKIAYIEFCLNKIIKSSERHSRSKTKYAEILSLRASGKTFKEISDKCGLTRQRIQQICSKHLIKHN